MKAGLQKRLAGRLEGPALNDVVHRPLLHST